VASGLRLLAPSLGVTRAWLITLCIFPFVYAERLTKGRMPRVGVLFPFYCKDHGYKFWSRVGDFHSFVEEYEPLTTHAAESLIDGSVAVDVGANIGIHTIHFAKRAKLVISIEPHPYLLKILVRNIKANRLNNVIVVPAAVSNQNGTARLYKAGHMWTLQASRYHEPGSRKWRQDSIGVVTLTLETIFTNFGIKEVGLLKVDVEGAECLALEGLGEYLRPEKVKALIVEVDKGNEEKIRMLCKQYRHMTKLENSNYLILP